MYISFLGDSITTYEGSNPPGFLVYYSAHAMPLEKTWFSLAAKALNGQVLVNNSFCGSCIASASRTVPTFPSAASTGRLQLDDGRHKPDLILIYMGINDVLNGVDCSFRNEEIDSFYGGYDLLLRSLKQKYPDAQIGCISPFGYPDIKRDIEDLCAKHKTLAIVLHKAYETWDGYHPLEKGMAQLAGQVIAALQEAGSCGSFQSA